MLSDAGLQPDGEDVTKMSVDTTSPTAAMIMRMTPAGETANQGLGVALRAWYMAVCTASVTALKTRSSQSP